MLGKFEKIINYFEKSKVPYSYFILTFVFAVSLRIFLEIFSSKTTLSFDVYYHYFMFYVAIVLAFSLLLYYATREKILNILKVTLPFILIIIIAPIVDLIVTNGKGYIMTYFLPKVHDNLLLRFFTFFGTYENMGVTIGQKLEIALILMSIFAYIMIKTKSMIKSLVYTFLSYCIFFLFASTILIVKFLAPVFLKGRESYLNLTPATNYFLLITFILLLALYYYFNKKYFMEILKDLRYLRVLHYQAIFIIGILVSKTYFFSSFEFYFTDVVFILISIVFASLYSIFTNNIADINIDKISNKTRPTVTKKISLAHYKILPNSFLFLSLLYAANVNFLSAFFILIFIGNYFLYSMPPFRLKRIPFLSKIFVSLNTLTMFCLGIINHDGEILNIFQLPIDLVLIFVLIFLATINFIDIKDYYGDKRNNIKTLPTIFGLKKSKLIIGTFFAVSYLSLPFIINKPELIYFAAVFAILQFYFINKENYSEKPIFAIYYLTIILIVYIL